MGKYLENVGQLRSAGKLAIHSAPEIRIAKVGKNTPKTVTEKRLFLFG